jgi:hypothetical protein
MESRAEAGHRYSRTEHLLVDPDVWIFGGDARVVAVVDVDLIDVAVATPVDINLEVELGALPSAAAHILASPCRPAVISELILLSDPNFEEEH